MAEPALDTSQAPSPGPGPAELRLPTGNGEPLAENTELLVSIVDAFGALTWWYRHRRDVFVGADLLVHRDPRYGERDADGTVNRDNPPVAPDIMVALGVSNRHRLSYVTWEEGKAPDFVLEVVSPSSKHRDREKKAIYESMGVREYFLYDPTPRRGPGLRGFELRDGAYRRLRPRRRPDGSLALYSKTLRLYACIETPHTAEPGVDPLERGLRWYDPVQDQYLQTHHEALARLEQAESRVRALAEQVATLQAQVQRAED